MHGRQTIFLTRSKRALFALLFVLCLPSAIAQPAAEADSGHPVIVVYREGVNAEQMTASLTSNLRSAVWGARRPMRSLRLVRGAAFAATDRELASLAADSRVAAVFPDRKVAGTLEYARESVGGDIAFQAYNIRGRGIGVAVIDSGVNNHRDLKSWSLRSNRVVYHEDFSGTKGQRWDAYGHGTHVAAIIAGNGKSSSADSFKMFKGLAPKAKIVDLRVLDGDGEGRDSYVIAAIQRAIQLRDQYNIRVINLSIGRPVYDSYTVDPLCQAVKAAWDAGIVVVAAAGNSGRENKYGLRGYSSIAAPGNSPYAITVGAMKPRGTATPFDDEIASYSSKGPTLVDHVAKPDLVAPGNRIISAKATLSHAAQNYRGNIVPLEYYRYMSPGSDTVRRYIKLSGTSMAAPMVAGAAALLLENDPSMTPDQVKAVLMVTASKNFPTSSTATHPKTGEQFESHYDIFTVGAGYLDIPAALTFQSRPQGKALSPVVAFDQGSQTVKLSTGQSVIWGRGVAWGTRSVWGHSAIASDDTTVNGHGVVWGGRSTRAMNVIWSQESPWSDSDELDVQSGHAEAMTVLLDGEN